MSSAMRSSIKLTYNGSSKTQNITDNSDSFTFTDNASGEADTVSITVDNRDGRWTKSGYFPQASDYFQAWIELKDWMSDGANRQLYCGKFQVDSAKLSGFPESVSLKGISIPIRTSINVTQRTKTYKKQSTKVILEEIAKRAGIKLVYDAANHSVDEINQSGKTDLAFAFSLCQEYDISLKIYNDKLIAYEQKKYEAKTPSYTITKDDLGGSGAYSYNYQITDLCDSVKIKYTKGKETLSYSYTIPGKSGKRTLFVTEKAESYADAEKKAKARLRQNNRDAMQISLKLTGDVRYKAAETFKLEGFGQISGVYFIDSVQHSKSRGSYTCSVSAHRVVTW